MFNEPGRWLRGMAALLVVACAACTSTGGSAPDRAIATKQAAGNPNQKLALIIGNSKYAESPLVNPVNDARAMSSTLTGLGFNVTALYDASLTEMNEAARQFGDKLRAGGVGLFFYAGHGMQIRGKNYLIPVGSDIKREDEVQYKAFDANQLLDKMESARNPINIVILDACRNNPFSRSFRSSASGLAQMEAPVGTYVSFSTAPGKVASDGEGANGLFTQHLLTSLRTPGQKVEDVFKQVRVRVMQDSGGQQIPWDSSSLTGDFYFLRPDPDGGTKVADAEPAPRPAPAQARPVAPETQSRVAATTSSQVQQPPAPSSASQSPPSQSPPSQSQSPQSQSQSPPSPPQSTAAKTPAPVTATPPTQSAASRPAPPPASAGPAQSAASAKTDASPAQAGNTTRPLTKAQQAAADRILLAKANTAPSSTPPAQSGGDDSYRRGVDAVKRSDMQGAFEAFSQAAEQGSAAAQYEVGVMQKTGRNPVKQDVAQARRWLTRAADQGHVAAQYELGQMYDQGVGGEKNCKEGEKWLRKAADRAHLDAMVQLGWLHLRGCGGDKNPSEAAKWLRQAAAKGSRDAQFSLGVLYFNGEGVSKDPKEARKLLEAAASKGHPSAKFYLDRLQ